MFINNSSKIMKVLRMGNISINFPPGTHEQMNNDKILRFVKLNNDLSIVIKIEEKEIVPEKIIEKESPIKQNKKKSKKEDVVKEDAVEVIFAKDYSDNGTSNLED
jgi:hypothetical protein